MNKVVKRIRLQKEVDEFMAKIKLNKQKFIEIAIIEKLERDFKFKQYIPF